MSSSPSASSYQRSGVDLDRMDELKDRIRSLAASTHGPEVVEGGSSFAGMFQLDGDDGPVLVASTDGVGTKLKIAAQLGHFESIGRDLVTLNVNDILTKGRAPPVLPRLRGFQRRRRAGLGLADARHSLGMPGGPMRTHRRRDGADAGGCTPTGRWTWPGSSWES